MRKLDGAARRNEAKKRSVHELFEQGNNNAAPSSLRMTKN